MNKVNGIEQGFDGIEFAKMLHTSKVTFVYSVYHDIHLIQNLYLLI